MNGRRGFLAACLAAVCAPVAAMMPSRIGRPATEFESVLIHSWPVFDESGRRIATRRSYHIRGWKVDTYRVMEYPSDGAPPFIRTNIPGVNVGKFGNCQYVPTFIKLKESA